MAATRKFTLSFHSSDNGESPNIVKGLIAGTQGILIPGAPMYLSQSGTWKLCDTSDATDAWHGFIVGRAASPSTWPLTAALTANDEIYVALIDAKHIYSAYLEASGSDVAATQADVGDQVGCTVSATATEVGLTTVDTGNANATVKIVDIASNKDTTGRKYATTDNPGVVYVRFLQSIIDATKA